MKFRTRMLWSVVNHGVSYAQGKGNKRMEIFAPLVEALFPGATCFSVGEFDKLISFYVIPVLKRQFSQLLLVSAENIPVQDMTEVGEFLPANGSEWQHEEWQKHFAKLLLPTNQYVVR